MKSKHYMRLVGVLLAGGAGLAIASYATYAGITWYRYGRTKHQVSEAGSDSLLDLYMPECEIAERHHIRVDAPVEATFAAASEMKMQSAVVGTIFKERELVLSCAESISRREFTTCGEKTRRQKEAPQQKAFLAEVMANGWSVLAEIPGREIVLGTVTQPWVAAPVFRPVPSDEFAAFHEPGYVKIVFTLCADPVSAGESVASTETRVATTDPLARAKFRRYWALVSPGVILIRRELLRRLKAEAERRVGESNSEYHTAEFGQYAER